MTPIISVENLGKKYTLRHEASGDGGYRRLSEDFVRAIKKPFRQGKFPATQGANREEFWALKDVSFEVQQGEVLGIIGRNGAGKSTLLKILSRITEPTEGRVRIRGRVASLLEVGTGFHPELTGRENVFLNGAILGMSKSEIRHKFDEIVAFAEVEKFLDTPVKRYSSGMYVRLAFAVAAHLDPEVLVVDEVLSVGDAEFQSKCLGKMGEVARGGRTALFVSHNLAAVRRICTTAILLRDGRCAMRNRPDKCIDEYLADSQLDRCSPTLEFRKPEGASLWMTAASVQSNGHPTTTISMGDPLEVAVVFASHSPIYDPRLGIRITNTDGIQILSSNNRFQLAERLNIPARVGTIHCDLGSIPFVGKRYFMSLFFGDRDRDTHIVENAFAIEVLPADVWGSGATLPSARLNLWWRAAFTVSSFEEPFLVETK